MFFVVTLHGLRKRWQVVQAIMQAVHRVSASVEEGCIMRGCWSGV